MSKNELLSSAPSHIHETKVRLIASGVFLVTLLLLLTGYPLLPLFLVIDFALRSFDLGKFSPLALLADWVVRQLAIGPKPIFYPPKRFAARVGLLFSVVITTLYAAGIPHWPVSGTLVLFSGLEAFAGICAGCYVYNWVPAFLQGNGSARPADTAAERPVKEITVQELVQWTEQETAFQFIDVREPHEYETANLGATLIPLGTVEAQFKQFRTDIPVVVQCRSGVRSAKAIRLLEDKFGWTNLYNLQGGILAYQAAFGQ